MAILNSLIVSGASRFLNTAYFQDVSISGTATLSSLSLSGNLSVTGTSTLSGNTTVGGTLGVTGAATFNNWITTANNYGWKSAYGGGWYMNGPNYIRSYGKPVLMDHNMYFGTAGDTGYYVKTTGAAKFASVVAPTGSIATLNSDNVSVSNNLHATNFDLQTVAQLGGSFYVSPTVKFPNSGTKLAVSKSSTQLTLTIKDSSISTSTMAGIVWTANSAVKVSGTINGVVTGTMDGTIDSITNGSQMVVKVSGGNWNSVSATSTDLTSSQFSDLTVMVYQRHDGSNDYRVGIWMNCYDLVNSSSTIRVYGGTSSTPNVTIGNLTGSTFNGETISGNNNWGILTTMGYFEGAIVSTEGQIGGWTIGDTKLYHNTNSITSTDAGLYLGTDGIRNYSSGTQYVNITSGKITALGVDVSGKITATSGAIGGFDITSTAIKTKDVAVTSNADNSISLSSADFTRTINGTSRAGLRFAIGDKFGVTGDGIIYASSVDLTGKITATSGTIGGCSITDGVLYITDANVSGTISANHINTSSITIAQSQVSGLTTALNGKASTSSVTNAAKTATDYIFADSSGIKVSYTTNPSNYLQITSDGTKIYKSSTQVASYGSSIILGELASGKTHVEIDDNSFDVCSGANTGVNSTKLATFGAESVIGNMSTRGVSITDKGFKFNNDGIPAFYVGVDYREGLMLFLSDNYSVSSSSTIATIDNKEYYYICQVASDRNVLQVGDNIYLTSDEDDEYLQAADSWNYNDWVINSGKLYISKLEIESDSDTIRYIYSKDANSVADPYCVIGKSVYSTQNPAGIMSLSQGDGCTASGAYSTSVGWRNTSSGMASISCGNQSKALADYSFAGGFMSTASGENSFAYGYKVTVSNKASVAIGYGSTASGNSAFARGINAIASGYCSYSSGCGTVALESYNTVIGRYNKANIVSDDNGSRVYQNTGDYPFIIGNGTADTDAGRSNALTVDWSGNVWAAGKVMAANTSYVGMIIMSTTLDTMAKVISVYGGTTWIQHSGYFLYGASSGVTANHAVADGGEAYHTLTINEMPSHSHKVRYTGGYVNGFYGGMPGTSVDATPGYNDLLVAYEGGGQAHNNMPPYKNVYIWERTA